MRKMFLTEYKVLIGWRHWPIKSVEISKLCRSLQWCGRYVV